MRPQYYIKIGGSLIEDISQLDHFLVKLVHIFGTSVIINVGSGYLGEVYKQWVSIDERIENNYYISSQNWSIIQQLNANIIAALNGNYSVGSTMSEVEDILSQMKIPIINPIAYSDELFSLKLYTSDLKAVYLCNKFKCNELIIFTDVDGIYTVDPKKNADAQKIKRITPKQLAKMEKTSLDYGAHELLMKYHIPCRVCGVAEFLDPEVCSVESFRKCGTLVSDEEALF